MAIARWKNIFTSFLFSLCSGDLGKVAGSRLGGDLLWYLVWIFIIAWIAMAPCRRGDRGHPARRRTDLDIRVEAVSSRTHRWISVS